MSRSEIILSQMEDELPQAATCKDHLQVRAEGRREATRESGHYITPKEAHA